LLHHKKFTLTHFADPFPEALCSLQRFYYSTFLLKDIMLVLTKITYCRDGQIVWSAGHFEMAAFCR